MGMGDATVMFPYINPKYLDLDEELSGEYPATEPCKGTLLKPSFNPAGNALTEDEVMSFMDPDTNQSWLPSERLDDWSATPDAEECKSHANYNYNHGATWDDATSVTCGMVPD